MKNYYIEGAQGSGKSTLANKLAGLHPDYKVYREGDISPVELAWCSYMTTEQYEEALAKYAHLTDEIKQKTMRDGECFVVAYTQILAEDREFYEYMESFEIYNARVSRERFREIIIARYKAFADAWKEERIGNIFECSFFQNSIESMMLFYCMTDEEIIAFYKEAYEILKDTEFRLIYLKSGKIRENITQIRKERVDTEGNELWFPLMMGYLKESPYGQQHGYETFDDLIHHLERRKTLELRCIQEFAPEHVVILRSKEYDDGMLRDLL